jgi:hypothetical protein
MGDITGRDMWDARCYRIEQEERQRAEERVKSAMRVPDPIPLIHPVHLTSQMSFLFGANVAWVGVEGQGGDIHVHYRDGRKCIYIATEVAHGT